MVRCLHVLLVDEDDGVSQPAAGGVRPDGELSLMEEDGDRTHS